ncbi:MULTISPECIES: radical SAM family heme chaperone HemW [unclassified Mycobacterium]|uniref:radical SAM family heme chaperone HemW n=1 Tax=unclassified Mycobacterium TaxID=2642494 RepID=UPI00073FAB73|nr:MULTISPECIES: radical SAM family heme chaperone HemW [unclassified Mycobacterium]KUH80469.1 coproporphyrinogen III oxidase [Mycobacterium sp. GA-1999]KUH89160.1 coproporphyrinogen III oxidase [Mycobacterium sp. GA-0227b]KUH95894.1 coproporphyrinogen III oxidase [Mycobacterium sp. IS-1556]
MTRTAAPTGRSSRERSSAELPVVTPTPGRPFGVYIHVPFCATRCGYCDFNTYTPAELGGADPGQWLVALRAELTSAAQRLGSAPRVDTVFVGGGTPSLLGGAGLAAVLDAVRTHFPLAPDAEVTTEANPESTSPPLFDQLREAGYTRVSLGMQSAAPHVLATLDRTHSPGRALGAAREARAAGFEHVNLDLIYGTPGESDDDLLRSVDTVVEAGVDHVSAYALVVEDGTAMARRVRRGELAPPDDDVLARRYELLDARLTDAGFDWYEVSNWSRPGGECLHNIGYWNGGQWWGAGPGAHGFVGAVRWWNVKHPNTYAQMLADGRLPVADCEQLDAETMHIEDVMLRVRLRDGLPTSLLTQSERRRADTAVADGLLTPVDKRLALTDRGRLLADAVVRDLLD